MAERDPACRRREGQRGSCTERENLSSDAKGETGSGSTREERRTDAGYRDGAARSRDEGSVMELDRRGCVVQPRLRANRRREELVDKAKPFDIPKREVWEAFKRVKANQGAAGVDRQSIADFEADLSNNLYRLWNLLSSGSYFPPPVRRVDIPKGRWWHAPVGHPDGRRSHRSGGRPSVPGAVSGNGVLHRLLRLQARSIGDRCRAPSSSALLAV